MGLYRKQGCSPCMYVQAKYLNLPSKVLKIQALYLNRGTKIDNCGYFTVKPLIYMCFLSNILTKDPIKLLSVNEILFLPGE